MHCTQIKLEGVMPRIAWLCNTAHRRLAGCATANTVVRNAMGEWCELSITAILL